MGTVIDEREHLHRRRRDLNNRIARWIVLLSSVLLIGMAAGEEDHFFVHKTLFADNVAAASIPDLVAPVLTPSPAQVQPSDTLHTVQVEPIQAESLARSNGLRTNSPVSVADPSRATWLTPTVEALEPETRLARPSRAAVNAAPVQTWPMPGFDLYIHVPPDAIRSEPLQVILALHGMGGQGQAFAQDLIADADRNRWLVVAPTLPYGDYMNPLQLAEDDVHLSQMLAATLDALPQRLGYKLLPQVLVFGFSRGAQLGHRFAMFYPERVEAVAIVAAGSYTLPTKVGMTESGPMPLLLPYGLADAETRLNRSLNMDQFQTIPFLIAVGDKDIRPDDVPRQFDFLGGTTRVARAQSFHRALKLLGMDCQLVIAPNADHQVSSDMLVSASKFLKDNAPKPSQVNVQSSKLR